MHRVFIALPWSKWTLKEICGLFGSLVAYRHSSLGGFAIRRGDLALYNRNTTNFKKLRSLGVRGLMPMRKVIVWIWISIRASLIGTTISFGSGSMMRHSLRK